jgi:NDP-sugar pyrophosphorylase family protein
MPIGERSILELQVLRLKEFGFENIYVATYYKANYIEAFLGDGSRYGVRITVSREEEPLGTCGPVKLLESELDTPFLVMNSDILTTADFGDLYEFAMGIEADLVVATKEIMTPFSFGRIHSEGGMITAMEEKPELKTEVLAGVYIFKPPVLRLVPAGEYFGMDSLIKKMLEQEAPIGKYLIRQFWLDIGQIEDYQEAQEAYRQHFQESP